MALEDLDELILRCRDEKARLYIAEAVASYRSGAFRSAIVASWIAVCFDVIEKLRELALAGDNEAEKQVEEIEVTRRTANLTQALKFERELLALAKDKFELISHIEFIDLERLQADRNRCAHPSLTSDEQAYTPSAELARLHIHSAVIHLLQHPPVQGKYALERVLREIDSDYFPSGTKEAKEFFASGPLRRPRESLVRSLTIVLSKVLLNDKPQWKRRMRIAAALQAIQQMHPEYYRRSLGEKLSTIVRAVADDSLIEATKFLNDVPDSWQYLDADIQRRLQNFVEALPAEWLEEVEFLLKYPPLQKEAGRRIKGATRKELQQSLFLDMPIEVADRYIDIYLESPSFDDANSSAKVVATHSTDFTENHIRRILTNAAQKNQIVDSFQLGPLILTLRSRKKLPEIEFEQLLKDHGLGQYAIELLMPA